MSSLDRVASRVILAALAGVPLIAGAQTQDPDAPADEWLYQLETEFQRSSLARASFGSYVDEETKEHIVVLPADVDAKAIEMQVRRTGSSPQRFQHARMTRATQARLEQALVTRNYHSEATKYSMATYFDLKSGKQVVVTDAPRNVTDQLQRQYPNQIELQFGAIISDASRHADRQLFSGGAGILASGGGYCTSAWKVRQGSVPGVLAPGHCRGPSGPYYHFDSWDGVVGYGSMPTRTLNPDVGFIWWTGSGTDVYRAYIYKGSPNSSTTVGVVGGRDPNLNQAIYYRSGAVTGQVAGITITSLNATYVDQAGVTHTNAMAYTSPTGSQGGDSGAPIFVPSTSGSSVHVRGFHTARSTSGNLHFGEKYSRAMTGSTLVCSSSSCYTGS